MTRKQRSLTLDRAEARHAAVSAIENVQLANELTLEGYSTAISTTRTQLATYNGLLAQAEDARREFLKAERSLADLSERVLASVGASYGRDSQQYGKAGGTPRSEYRRRSSGAASAPTSGTNAA